MQKRKAKPKVRAVLREWVFENGIRDKQLVVDRCKQTMSPPNLKALEDQYWNRQACSILASVRDKDHVRECFPVHTPEGVVITHISKTKSLRELDNLEKRFVKNIYGNGKSLAKIKRRKEELYEQINLFAIGQASD